ncbi:MAG: hypothetical protein KBD73_01835 [Candidatus Magasanikbacteria bacterium]|nr:hypothetical protein [Candidatus Magasanikbacteria bacterium]
MNLKLYTAIGLAVAVIGLFLLVQKKTAFSPVSVTPDSANVVSDRVIEVDLETVLDSSKQIVDNVNKQNQTTKTEPVKTNGDIASQNQTSNGGVSTQPGQSAISVTINWEKLTSEEVQSLKNIYGSVTPGDYWYDRMTGLYGVMGNGPLGIIATGYNFDPMPRNASNGNTNVIINGREITYGEVALLTRYVGQVIPGSYWLDASGNFGLTGSNVALGNLYASGGASGGSGGDNFWSSSYSAGNSNADNTEGYVSVPGIGPVGYGM